MTTSDKTQEPDILFVSAVRRASVSPAARRVRQIAKARQAEISAVCGKEQSTIAHWEALRRVPSGDTAIVYVSTLVELARNLHAEAERDDAVVEFVGWGRRLDALR